jgi:TetR/AcrR family transcriptional repressor of mexJK operon
MGAQEGRAVSFTVPARSGTAARRRGGRPSRLEAALLPERILDVATALFLTQGFGATSIEAVAERARISKRTFYHRFDDKAALFQAVVRRFITRWLASEEAAPAVAATVEEALLRSATGILAIALSPEALALHRVVIAEAQRFPELARAVSESGARAGVERIAGLLESYAGADGALGGDVRFAAEQFINMVLAVPQKRALGLGEPLDAAALERWARDTVALFLDGWRGGGDDRRNRT